MRNPKIFRISLKMIKCLPGSLKKTKEQNELNKILNIPKENITKKKSKTNIEQSIINKIGK